MPAGDMPAGARGQAFQYPAGELITSSLSNKGNPTAFGQDNTFRVLEQNAVRIIDNKGNLLFSGTGPEAARQAVEIGKNLSDTLGNKAGWTIQTGERTINPDGSVGGMRYYDVANEKVNKSTLDKIAGVVGTALPIAVGFIPGLQGVGAVLASAGAGGVGAALRGDDILKGVAMGGLSAAGGQYLGDALKGAGMGLSTNAARAIGTGIGSTAGGVVTGQDFGNALLGGVASGGLSYLSGEIMKPGAPKPTGQNANVSSVNAPIDPSAITVTGTRIANLAAPSVNFNAAPKSTAPKEQPSTLTPDEIIVTAGRGPALTSSVFSVPGLTPLPQEITDFAAKPAEELPPAEEAPPPEETPLAEEPAAVDDAIIVTGGRTPALTSSTFSVPGLTPLPKEITDLAAKTTEELPPEEQAADDAIIVTGGRTPALTSSTFTVPGLTPLPKEITDLAKQKDVTEEDTADEEDTAKDEIIVKATPTATTGSSTFAVGGPDIPAGPTVDDEIVVTGKRETPPDTTSSTLAVGGPDIPAGPTFDDEIVVTGKKAEEPTTGSSVLTVPGLTPLPKEVVDAADKATDTKKDDGFGVKELLALLGAAGVLGGGGGGGGGGTGTGTGTGKLQPIFSAKLPTPGEGGSLKVGGLKGPTLGAAGTYSVRPVTDWYRYGMGPAMDIPAGTDLSGATSPYAGYGPGTLGQETFKAVSGIPEQPTGMYAGGSMGYSRGSSRESFAVNGPGTGRSDDIPAVLSDGEYVIDAETVALLGDGSSKAGAKRLDDLRVNIRKHKGRNLAKGKFSVNAKRPEKYLSGGRA